jgi:hypothetical protein
MTFLSTRKDSGRSLDEELCIELSLFDLFSLSSVVFALGNPHRITISSPNPLTDLGFVQPAAKDVVLCNLDGLHEWRFLSPEWSTEETDPALSTSGRQYSELHLDLVAKRVYNYYLYNIALVVFLIASLSVLSFCVELQDLANRTSITLTLLLTSVAFKITLSEKLPNVAYLTLLDQYILWSLVFLYMVAMVQGLMGSLPAQMDCSHLPDWAAWVDHGPDGDNRCSLSAQRLDLFMGIAFAGVFFASHAYFVHKVVPLL